MMKDYFIPHKDNDHKPRLLREAGVITVLLLAVLLFGVSAFHFVTLDRDLDFLAAVIPAVVVDLTNNNRLAADIPTLRINPVLEEAAQRKANHMAEHGYFAHVSPDGVEPWHWFREAGYAFLNAGENLAINYHDSADVEQAWMDSPGHRANILNGSFTEIGVASAYGTLDGRRTLFVVQLFGTPASLPALAATTPTIGLQTAQEPQAVLGEQTQAVAPSTIETVVDNDMFIAVHDTSYEETPQVDTPEETILDTDTQEEVPKKENIEPAPTYASRAEHIATQPHTLLKYAYIILILIIALVLLVTIFVQVHKQHPKNIFYGVLLVILIVMLGYLNYLFFASGGVIV